MPAIVGAALVVLAGFAAIAWIRRRRERKEALDVDPFIYSTPPSFKRGSPNTSPLPSPTVRAGPAAHPDVHQAPFSPAESLAADYFGPQSFGHRPHTAGSGGSLAAMKAADWPTPTINENESDIGYYSHDGDRS